MIGPLIGRVVLPRNSKAKVRRPVHQRNGCPTVSVVIPCYNYGHYLAECVGSVLDQPDVTVDVLIIDDASPDGSAEIAREFAARHSQVTTICHASNRGHIATYNEGLALARGDYTVLLSADDLLTPGCLARATSLMEENTSVGLSYGFSVELTDARRPPARTVATSWIIWPGHDWIAHKCRTGRNVLQSPEAVIRTEVLREIGGYRSHLPHAADFELWMRAAVVSDIGYVGGADQAYYRIHSNNMHHSAFDVLADLNQRLRCFDDICTEHSEALAHPGKLRDAAYRALSREALGHAISAYARGVADQEPIDDYAIFAEKAWPDVRQLRDWRFLSSLHREGGRWAAQDIALKTREMSRNLNYSLRWWRRRLAGV